MIRGITLMKCTECGKRFWGPDIELYASTLSQPLRCPKCGSVRTRPSRLFSPFTSNKVYCLVSEEQAQNEKVGYGFGF